MESALNHNPIQPATRASAGRAWLALLLLVPAPTLGVIAAMFVWPDTAFGKALYQAAKVWILVLPIVWMFCVEGVRPRLPRWSWRGMPTGLITGVLTMGVIIGAWELFARGMVDVSVFQEKMQAIGLNSPAKYLRGRSSWPVCASRCTTRSRCRSTSTGRSTRSRRWACSSAG